MRKLLRRKTDEDLHEMQGPKVLQQVWPAPLPYNMSSLELAVKPGLTPDDMHCVGRECQVAHWTKHKGMCKELVANAARSATTNASPAAPAAQAGRTPASGPGPGGPAQRSPPAGGGAAPDMIQQLAQLPPEQRVEAVRAVWHHFLEKAGESAMLTAGHVVCLMRPAEYS